MIAPMNPVNNLGRTSNAAIPTQSLVSAARFVVSCNEVPPIAFSEMTGITSEVEVSEYLSSGTMGIVMAKQFGKTKPATVVLKRGIDQEMALWVWHKQVLAGLAAARRECTLELQDITGLPVQSYRLTNAWPSKLEIGALKAAGSEAVIATVTLTCDQIDLVPRGGRAVV